MLSCKSWVNQFALRKCQALVAMIKSCCSKPVACCSQSCVSNWWLLRVAQGIYTISVGVDKLSVFDMRRLTNNTLLTYVTYTPLTHRSTFHDSVTHVSVISHLTLFTKCELTPATYTKVHFKESFTVWYPNTLIFKD